MLIVTNRNISEDGFLFGNQFNIHGPTNLRFAVAETPESIFVLNETPDKELPSARCAMREVIAANKEKKNIVVYIHGFSTSAREAVESAFAIEKNFNVRCILFTWPSDPGGIEPEQYIKAKTTGVISAVTFYRFMKIFRAEYIKNASDDCKVSLSLMAHSMGNYLLRNYSIIFQESMSVFDNIMLSQADVDFDDPWFLTLDPLNKLYITYNKNDSVLKASDSFFQKNRLGQSGPMAYHNPGIKAYDLTKEDNVGKKHNLFLDPKFLKKSKNVARIFNDALNGV